MTAINPVFRSGGGPSVLIAGTFDGVDVKSEARYDEELDTIFRQATLSAYRRLPGGVEVTALLGFSRSDFSNPVQNTLHLDQYGVNGFAYDFRDRARPYVGYGRRGPRPSLGLDAVGVPRRSELGRQQLQDHGPGPEGRRGRPRVARGGVAQGLSDCVRHPVAIQRHHRQPQRRAAAGAGRHTGRRLRPNGRRRRVLRRRRSARRVADAGYQPRAWPVAAGLRPEAGCDTFRLGSEPVAATNYAISERDDAAYVLVSRPRPGGAKVVGRRRASLSPEPVRTRPARRFRRDGALQPVRARRSYGDVLPSANLVWEPADDLTVRFGAARVMVRPDLRSLRPGFTVSTTSLKTVSAGDPDLIPSRATSLDLAIEWFAPNGGAVTVAAYHKSIRSVIQQTITQPAPFSANPYGLPDSVAVLACGGAIGCDPALPIWQFGRPANTGKGRLNGLEISAAHAARRAGLGLGALAATGLAGLHPLERPLSDAGRPDPGDRGLPGRPAPGSAIWPWSMMAAALTRAPPSAIAAAIWRSFPRKPAATPTAWGP
ncbi:TonB-dependent receptor domain-containing protein [Caulobacter segnis]